MAYCKAEDVYEAWADITEAEGGATRVANAIAFADAMIDASLTCRYTVPFNTVPTLIKAISTDLAAFITK